MKKTILGISPFLVQVLAIVLNFNALLQGRAATSINVAISLLYFAFWICFIPAMKRYNAYQGLLASLVFWGLVLLTALLTLTVNIFDIDLPMLVPFTTLFLAPTYGVRIEQLSNMAALSIIAIIAIVYIVYCAVEAKRVKRN